MNIQNEKQNQCVSDSGFFFYWLTNEIIEENSKVRDLRFRVEKHPDKDDLSNRDCWDKCRKYKWPKVKPFFLKSSQTLKLNNATDLYFPSTLHLYERMNAYGPEF